MFSVTYQVVHMFTYSYLCNEGVLFLSFPLCPLICLMAIRNHISHYVLIAVATYQKRADDAPLSDYSWTNFAVALKSCIKYSINSKESVK